MAICLTDFLGLATINMYYYYYYYYGHGSVEMGDTTDNITIKDSIKLSDVATLMIEAQKSIAANNCFPVAIRDRISRNELSLTEILYNEITKIYMGLM